MAFSSPTWTETTSEPVQNHQRQQKVILIYVTGRGFRHRPAGRFLALHLGRITSLRMWALPFEERNGRQLRCCRAAKNDIADKYYGAGRTAQPHHGPQRTDLQGIFMERRCIVNARTPSSLPGIKIIIKIIGLGQQAQPLHLDFQPLGVLEGHSLTQLLLEGLPEEKVLVAGDTLTTYP